MNEKEYRLHIKFHYGAFLKMKVRGFISGVYVMLKIRAVDFIGEHCPVKIPRKFPAPPPGLVCADCGKPMNKLAAYNGGDGWGFQWECENHCGTGPDEAIIDNWWPFLFGAWCYEKDLRKIGIEVL